MVESGEQLLMALFKEIILMPPVEIASTCYTYEVINKTTPIDYIIICVLKLTETP